jgi:hypothetical protein
MALRRMSEVGQPLLEMVNKENGQPHAAHELPGDGEFKVTELGEAAIKGEADFVLLNGIDLWLGGVYLSDQRNLWRWDEQQNSIKLR